MLNFGLHLNDNYLHLHIEPTFRPKIKKNNDDEKFGENIDELAGSANYILDLMDKKGYQTKKVIKFILEKNYQITYPPLLLVRKNFR